MPRHLDNNSKIKIVKIEDGFSIRQIARLMNIGKDLCLGTGKKC
jgi:IS30 family transposase